MTMDLEDRLWAQLEAAALREERRGRAARAVATVRRPFRARRLGMALAAAAALAVAVVAIVSLVTADRTVPQVSADRVVVRGAHLTSGTTAFDSLWAYDTASGQLLRLDARTHHVLARVPVPSPLAEVAIAAGPDAVWAVPIQPFRHSARAPAHPRRESAVRIDPRTNRVVARVAVASPIQPAGIVARPGAVWVWGEAGAMNIDPRDNRPVGVIGIAGSSVTGLAATDTRVSLATDLDELVTFDARTAARLAAVSISTPTERGSVVAVGGGVVMNRVGGQLASVDPISGRDLWVAHLGSLPRDLLVAGGRLWALLADPGAGRMLLVALDPGDGHTLARIPLPAEDARSIGSSGASPVISTQGGELLVPRR